MDDDFLNPYLDRYNRWQAAGKISFSSKVIPAGRSLEAKQRVPPCAKVEKILSGARSIALQECICRLHYKRCEKPLEVCLVLNESGDRFVEKGTARHVSLSEALDVVRKADENGLVRLSLYMPRHEIFALCSCCPCRRHDLRILELCSRKDLVARSEYEAVTDEDGCGECAARRPFDAREIRNDLLFFNKYQCLGCGLCVSACPAGAISMREIVR